MSNTVRRPRKRPRVTSYNFRTLGWLIRREAAWRIMDPYTPDEPRGAGARWLVTISTQAAMRLASKLLKLYPNRRYYP